MRKWVPRRYLLAPFHNIKGKKMGPLAFDVNSNISNCLWLVSRSYWREIECKQFYFSKAANQTPLWIPKEICFEKQLAALLIETCYLEAVRWKLKSNVHSIRWGCQWALVAGRKWETEGNQQMNPLFVLPANSSEALFYVVCLWTSCMDEWWAVSPHEAVEAQ